MDIFGSTVPGQAHHVIVDGASGAVSFSSGGLIPDGVLITGVGYSGKAAVQIMHTLGKVTYYYSFGLRDEAMVITGIAFARECVDGGEQQILRIAAKFRAAARGGDVVSVSAGGMSFRGVVDSLRTTWSDPNLGMLGFELRINLFTESAMSGTP